MLTALCCDVVQLGQQGLAEGYPPMSQGVSVNDANIGQLSALFPQVDDGRTFFLLYMTS